MRQYLKPVLFTGCFFALTLVYAQEAAAPEGPERKSPVLDALEIRDMDINDVLKLLAAKSGLNIIAGKSITGRVTIFLQDVDARDALTIILKANDLAYIEDRGVMQIVTAPEHEQITGHKFGVLTETAVVPLSSMKANDALGLLVQMKSSAGKVIADEQSNSIVIEDVPQRVKQLGDYIKAIDIPTETKVYKLQYAAVEMVADKIKEMVSPKIGSVKFDASSNKLFIKDAPKKLKEMDDFVKQIDNPRETRVFQVSYAKAEDLARTITPMLTKDIGNLQFDARSNTVVLTDIPPKIKAIEAVIEALDKNDKEVLIEAKIVQITLSDGYQMGINWEKFWPSAAHKVLTLKNDFSLSSTPSPVSVTTVGTLDRDGYAAVLQLIATFGKSRLLSNPRIAVVNRQEARILVGDNTPYVTSSTTTPATGAPVTAETVNFIDTGVKLHVTPVIHDDGYISMKIKPEVSNIPKTVTTGSKNEIPVVNTSEVETTIRVKDGVTIIIGGLIKDEVKNNRNKIPVLGDIPLVGKAFRSETRSTAKTEIVIFLTPHIISGDVRADPDTYSHPTIKPGKTYYSPVQDPSEGLVP